MRSFKLKLMGLIAALAMLPSLASAADTTHSAVALQGYDAVGYFTDHKPVNGNGNHVVLYEGVNYLFANDEHKKTFEANPSEYAPQFGGWCAYGVSVSKKFVGDPLVWKIVDGKLYVNLDKKIYNIWVKDIAGNLEKANTNWPLIKDKDPSAL